MWFGGLSCLIMGVVALIVLASSSGWLQPGKSLQVVAAEALSESSPGLADRTTCAEFGSSDLRSPSEGVWFQGNCVGVQASLAANSAPCNRTLLDPAEFTLVAPGLYVYRQSLGSRAYLWSSKSDTCFSLVSGRVVTVVCADLTVSFQWIDDACSPHGGVLAAVNAR
jgi:hypothetical protein